MKRVLGLTAVVTAVLTGCSTPLAPADSAPYPVGTSAHTIDVDGTARDYLVTVPANRSAESPLVVMLHGGFGSSHQARESYGWDAAAASGGFIVAYPNGVGRAWNAGAGCCGEPGRNNTDDVGFVGAMVAEIGEGIGIDASRVYATGMSNGAMLAYRLACDTELFAAIAPVAGTLLGNCDEPTATSVLHIHGEADTRVRLDGEPGEGASKVGGPPITDVISLWRQVADCALPSVTTVDVIATSAGACANGRAVTLITIADAGHQWPGSLAVRDRASTPSASLDATAIIWEFFASHPDPK